MKDAKVSSLQSHRETQQSNREARRRSATPSGIGQFSLEFFPPKGLPAERALVTGAHALRRFKPAFQTVTFGAGGTATDGCFEWCDQLQNLTETPTASHLALCHFENSAELMAFADRLWDADIKHLVVLRGDVEADDGIGCAGYNSVAEAVTALKKRHKFTISVSAYPEVHPKAESLDADIAVLLDKQKAGADRAITQFFFDNEDFYRFRERCEKAGLRIPLVPGIIPINNFDRIRGFSEKCGASVPATFEERFVAAGDDKAAQTDVARAIVEEQVRDLARNGVRHIHIYTLNRVDLAADTIRAFQAEFSGESDEEETALVG
ncbi:MAG: methylenetetrahydrofolate reductase [Pseudomonadota bacterium]